MKRVLCVLFAILLCISLFTACKEDKKEQPPVKKQEVSQVETMPEQEKTEEKENVLPFEDTKTFMFTTGVGGWYTELILKSDGSFTGNYRDSDMGSGGDGYKGTLYYCDFEGSFDRIEKVDDYSYRMFLKEVETTTPQDKTWIDGETLMVPSEPYGVDDGMYMLYLPGTNVTQFPEDFIYWWAMRHEEDGTLKTHLDCYCLHNTTNDCGFFTYE